MRNEELFAREHERYNQMADTEKKMYAYSQSKEGVGKKQPYKEKRLNDCIPLTTLYKSLVKHYKYQNRYIERLEAEVKNLKQEVLDKSFAIQSLKDKYEKTGTGDLVEQLEKSEKTRKEMAKSFYKFIEKHRREGVDVETFGELISDLKTLTGIDE